MSLFNLCVIIVCRWTVSCDIRPKYSTSERTNSWKIFTGRRLGILIQSSRSKRRLTKSSKRLWRKFDSWLIAVYVYCLWSWLVYLLLLYKSCSLVLSRINQVKLWRIWVTVASDNKFFWITFFFCFFEWVFKYFSFFFCRDPNVLEECNLEEKVKEVLLNNIKRRLTPQAVKIRAGNIFVIKSECFQ